MCPKAGGVKLSAETMCLASIDQPVRPLDGSTAVNTRGSKSNTLNRPLLVKRRRHRRPELSGLGHRSTTEIVPAVLLVPVSQSVKVHTVPSSVGRRCNAAASGQDLPAISTQPLAVWTCMYIVI